MNVVQVGIRPDIQIRGITAVYPNSNVGYFSTLSNLLSSHNCYIK